MIAVVFGYERILGHNVLWLDILVFLITIVTSLTIFVLLCTELAAHDPGPDEVADRAPGSSCRASPPSGRSDARYPPARAAGRGRPILESVPAAGARARSPTFRRAF